MMPHTEASLWTFLQTADDELIVFVSFFFFVTVIVALIVTGVTVSGIARRRIEAGLKQDMLDRGMSADEIATVIEAGPGGKRAAHRPPPHHPPDHRA